MPELLSWSVKDWLERPTADFERRADAMDSGQQGDMVNQLDFVAGAAVLRSAYLDARQRGLTHRSACRRANTAYRRVRRLLGYDPINPLDEKG